MERPGSGGDREAARGVRDPAPAATPAATPAAPSTMPGSQDWILLTGSLMTVWAVGGVVFLILIAATKQPANVEQSLRGIALLGFAVLAIMMVGRTRLPFWTPDVCALILYTLVGWIILVLGDPTSPYSFVYLWLVVHSFYFLHWKRAAPQVVYIGLTYALALGQLPGPLPLLRWTTTIVSAAVICTMVALLRNQVHRLVQRLEGLATTDALTGLQNRRAYDEIVRLALARADRTGESVTVLMADLDHFKRINDQLGHKAGDEVLRRAAHVLRDGSRQIDTAVRLGGEEFVVLLPATSGMSGFVVAERMRHLLRREFDSHPLPVTMSFGVATYPDDARDPDALLVAADTALLTAKRGGRDQTVRYAQPLDLPR